MTATMRPPRQVMLGTAQRDIVLHALRFNSWNIRNHWPAFVESADAIDALLQKLDGTFQQSGLFQDREHALAVSGSEKKLLIECLDSLAFEKSFRWADQSGARRIRAVAAVVGGKA